MCAVKKRKETRKLKKFFELISRGYRDGIKRRDKIGMGYDVMESLSVQFLQVDDVILILSPW